MNFFRPRAALILTACLLLSLSTLAQPPSQPQSAPAQQQMVKLKVLVLDSKNHPVFELRQEDFQVFEGDEPQTVSVFSKEDAPVSYGLLIDSSGSLRKQFTGVLRAGRTIIDANQPEDETFLMRFISTDKVYMEQDFTTDKNALFVKLNGFGVEGGQTAIIDAVYLAAEHLQKSKQGNNSRRHALILITDGEDRSSVMKQEELLKLLRSSDVQIFAIGMVSELDKEGGLIRKSPREKAIGLLEELAKETGGHVFFARSSSDLETIATDIARSLHTQYVIGYSPTIKPDKAGKDKASARKARVKLVDAPGRGKLKAIVRPADTVPR